VKKLFLGGFFTGNKLDIVNQKHVHLAVFLTESGGGFGADSIDKVVCEFLGRNVEHLQALL